VTAAAEQCFRAASDAVEAARDIHDCARIAFYADARAERKYRLAAAALASAVAAREHAVFAIFDAAAVAAKVSA
jgi:hypothetical protein